MKIKHRYVSQPVHEPVTVDECRLQMGVMQVGDNARDPIIASRIVTARTWAQDYTGTALATGQSVVSHLDRFPRHPSCVVALVSPLLAVSAIRYYDTAGTLDVLDTDAYIVDTVDCCVYPANGRAWPMTQDRPNAIRIEYTAGYAAQSDIPEPIKDAIKFTVGQWEHYQETIEGGQRPMTIPYAALQLLGIYKDYRGAF